MTKVYVTGVAGFLGSHLADALTYRGYHVVGIDNMIGGDYANISPSVDFYRFDCNELDDVKRTMDGCEIVFHCAATAYEGLSVFSPHLIAKNIVGASAAIFAAAAETKVKRIVFCSSMARYGKGLPPFTEDQPPKPQDPYGIAKVCAEDMLKNLCGVHGIEWTIAVPHNIIGPRQKYDDPYRNVASIMLNLMLQGRTPVIYGDGLQERCFSYVDDCISCLMKMGFQDDVAGQVVNIGPDEEPISIRSLYDLCAGLTGFTADPTFMDGRPQEVKVALCSSHKARELLGYKTQVPLRRGLMYMRDAMIARGTRAFKYHLPIEIANDLTPATWTRRLF